MKYILPLFLVFVLFGSIFFISPSLVSPLLSAKTVSGEIGNKPKVQSIPKAPSTPKIQYLTDTKGACYTLIKNKKTGKSVKRIVAKRYCKKTNTSK